MQNISDSSVYIATDMTNERKATRYFDQMILVDTKFGSWHCINPLRRILSKPQLNTTSSPHNIQNIVLSYSISTQIVITVVISAILNTCWNIPITSERIDCGHTITMESDLYCYGTKPLMFCLNRIPWDASSLVIDNLFVCCILLKILWDVVSVISPYPSWHMSASGFIQITTTLCVVAVLLILTSVVADSNSR